MSDDGAPTHDELVEQAETVLEATEASMYWPVAHGEALRLQQMIEELDTIEPPEWYQGQERGEVEHE